MREITNKTELAEFFRNELLPYYELHYREDLTLDDAYRLNLNSGLCSCALDEFNVYIYSIMAEMTTDSKFLFVEIMKEGYTAKESLLPRIEWMKNFITENLEDRNKILEAKILQWYAKTKDEDFAKHFGIHEKRKGNIL